MGARSHGQRGHFPLEKARKIDKYVNYALSKQATPAHRRNLRGVRGVRVPPTFWSGGYRTPHFLGV